MTAAGFILMIAIGVMGAYENVVPSLVAILLIIFGAAILIFALIASSIVIVADFWKAWAHCQATRTRQPFETKTKWRQTGKQADGTR